LQDLFRRAVPEAKADTIDLFVRRQLIKAAPQCWQLRLKEADFDSVEQMVEKIQVLQLASESEKREFQSTTLRIQNENRFGTSSNANSNSSLKCEKCTLGGHLKKDCRTKCRFCHKFGHIVRNCPAKESKDKPDCRRIVGTNDLQVI